jgi:predicted MFS family arabinose efflux permease
LTAAEVLTQQWRFWAMTMGFFLAVVSTNGTLVHVVAMLTDRGMSPEYATATLSSAGAGVILGRIACGSCLDRLYGPCVAVCFFLLSALGIACFATELAGFVPLLGGALLGVGLGANITIMAFFTSRYFGLKAYGKVFGVIFGIFLMGTGVGPYLNALSYDLLHSYEPALVGSCISLMAACLLLAPLGPYPFASLKVSTTNPAQHGGPTVQGDQGPKMRQATDQLLLVCTENLKPNILVMKSAKDRA